MEDASSRTSSRPHAWPLPFSFGVTALDPSWGAWGRAFWVAAGRATFELYDNERLEQWRVQWAGWHSAASGVGRLSCVWSGT